MKLDSTGHITPASDPDHPYVGRCFEGGGGPNRLWWCDSYDPRRGFWMTNPNDYAERINVSEPAMSRTFHVISNTGEEDGSFALHSQLGHLDKQEVALFGLFKAVYGKSPFLDCRFMVAKVAPGAIWILDIGRAGDRSITNDADAVCELLHKIHGPKLNIIYRDSEGRWAMLIHNQGKFLAFRHVPGAATEIPDPAVVPQMQPE